MFGNYGIEIPSEFLNEVQGKAAELGITIILETTEDGKTLVSSKLHPSTPERKKLDKFLFSLQKTKPRTQT